MKIKLTNDTLVRFGKGTALEVTEEEGQRLISLGNAEKVVVKTDKKKK